MSQKYLIAIDKSETSRNILGFMKRLLRVEDEITLYNVVPAPVPACDLNEPSLVPIFTHNKDIFCTMEEARKDDMKNEMKQAEEKLVEAGFSKDKIHNKIETEKKDVARHIVEEAENGKYDAIVMGKHNASRLSEILLGSVTNKVIHISKNIPVIVV